MAGSRALKSQSVKLIHDDCVNAKAHLGNKKFDLIYLDPPFGTGDVQHLGKHSYSDCYTGEEYLRFMRERLIKVCALLSAGGVILVHLDRHYVYEVKSILDNLGLQFKGDVIWVYRRWASNIDALQGNHDTVLVFSNNANVDVDEVIITNANNEIELNLENDKEELKREIDNVENVNDVIKNQQDQKVQAEEKVLVNEVESNEHNQHSDIDQISKKENISNEQEVDNINMPLLDKKSSDLKIKEPTVEHYNINQTNEPIEEKEHKEEKDR